MSAEPLGALVRALHPGLLEGEYLVTSPKDPVYNCVAHALGQDDHWWAPGGFPGSDWPDGIDQSETLDAWIQFFRLYGFVPTNSADFEDEMEKVAIYTVGAEATHVAVQLDNGRWSSKLGSLQDIEHQLAALEDSRYGSVALVMSRVRQR